MALLGVRVLGDPILREQTRLIDPSVGITDELHQLIADMFETMHAAEGIGIAAPQVGRSERVAVIDLGANEEPEQHTGPLVLINPEIVTRSSEKERAEEGCLSIPEIVGEVERPAEVTVRALDREGVPYELEAGGLLARCIQHEVDHLDGKLFIDYLSLLKRRLAIRKWEDEAHKYPGFVRTIVPGQSTRRRR